MSCGIGSPKQLFRFKQHAEGAHAPTRALDPGGGRAPLRNLKLAENRQTGGAYGSGASWSVQRDALELWRICLYEWVSDYGFGLPLSAIVMIKGDLRCSWAGSRLTAFERAGCGQVVTIPGRIQRGCRFAGR
jgi:hypothetical protein